jgi:hypothetical protein
MIIVRLLSPEPVGWLCHHQLYSGFGADIVMESISLKIPRIGVRYVEPASPVRKVEFKLIHENSDRFISNKFAGRSAWLSRFGQWQGDITDIVLMGNGGR